MKVYTLVTPHQNRLGSWRGLGAYRLSSPLKELYETRSSYLDLGAFPFLSESVLNFGLLDYSRAADMKESTLR